MKSLLFIIFTVPLFPICLQSQVIKNNHKEDTLYQWRAKFFDVSIAEVSPSGRWIALNKWRNLIADTLMLVDSRKPDLDPLNIVKMRKLFFTTGDHLLSSGLESTAWWDLARRTVIHFQNAKQAAPFLNSESFAILDRNKVLKIYDKEGQTLLKEEGVSRILSDNNSNLAFIKTDKDHSVIYNWNVNLKTKLLSTKDDLDQWSWSSKSDYLILHLKNKKVSGQKVMVIDKKSGTVNNVLTATDNLPDYTTLTEINDHQFFVENQTDHESPNKNVELWYGNDGDLASTIAQRSSEKKFGIYNARTGNYKPLPSGRFPTFSNILNDRYFLAFDSKSEQDYTRLAPDVEFFLYDSELETYKSLAKIRGKITVARDGSSIVYQKTDNTWMLFNLRTQQASVISSLPLKNPVFCDNGKNVFFNSSAGIYNYCIKKKKFTIINETRDLQADIINIQLIGLSTDYWIDSPIVTLGRSPIINLVDNTNGENSCGIFYMGKYKSIVPSTVNSLKDLNYIDKTAILIYRQENYNLFPQILMSSSSHKKSLVYSSKSENKFARKIRQEIITYQNTNGVPLKGLLYYPANFDPQKKYPIVLHIYQIQSNKNSDYIVAGELSPEGFDLQALLKKGYVVYLPDIVFGSEGTGISALDCVNNALDAIQSKNFIDFKRVGLVGHSHGGYETDFIATHSDRFAAYISGAGNSDLIRSYFSYNYQFSSPYYWQFENGQYEMPIPFAQNKKLYLRNSPIYNVDKVSSPILLWSGRKDENIATDLVTEFFIGLKRYNKNVVALFYPNSAHDVRINTPEMKDLNERVLDWWDYFLQDRKDIPWIQKQMKKDAD